MNYGKILIHNFCIFNSDQNCHIFLKLLIKQVVLLTTSCSKPSHLLSFVCQGYTVSFDRYSSLLLPSNISPPWNWNCILCLQHSAKPTVYSRFSILPISISIHCFTFYSIFVTALTHPFIMARDDLTIFCQANYSDDRSDTKGQPVRRQRCADRQQLPSLRAMVTSLSYC